MQDARQSGIFKEDRGFEKLVRGKSRHQTVAINIAIQNVGYEVCLGIL
jgi:hypothetical protein